ncbi:MAG: glycosyltransferase family 4 protein [Microcystaceae cyanobacterium]
MHNNQFPLTIGLVTTEYVTEENFDGGLSNYLHRVALSLKQLGHHPIIILLTNKSEVLTHKGIEVHRIRLRGWKLMALINLLTFNQLSSLAYLLWLSLCFQFYIKSTHKNRPFSIIHYPSCAGLGLFRPQKIPSVVRISSYIPLWNQAYELKPTLKVKLSEKIEDIAYTQADALFAPSKLNAKAVEEAIGRPVKVIETPFILETTDLNDSIYQTHLKDKKYLLFFGTIGLMKGCGLIADIIYPLLQTNPDLHFVLVGKDKGYLGFKGKSTLDQIKENAAEYQDRVIHFDRLTHDYLYPIVAHAYAVVLPSRIDNFPNTCLEAMGHKRVVIGTEGTSFEQLITDGESGFLCEKDNAQDLLRTINKVLQLNPEDKVKIEEKAAQRIEELRPEKVVNELVNFYYQVINDFEKKSN